MHNKEKYNIDLILKNICCVLKQDNIFDVDINFVNINTIRNLNKIYRNNDKPTDVLSFPTLNNIKYKHVTKQDGLNNYCFDEYAQKILLGSIVICYDVAKIQTPNMCSIKNYIIKLIIHSIVHLFGYDHNTNLEYNEMRAIEKHIYNKVK